MAYLGHREGLDFMQAGNSIYIWARKAWHRFCTVLEWFDMWPGKGIRKALWRGVWITLTPVDTLVS